MLEFLIGGTIYELLFTAGTVHGSCFWIFGFVARVRARADNVFKGKVNNREIAENRIFFINE